MTTREETIVLEHLMKVLRRRLKFHKKDVKVVPLGNQIELEFNKADREEYAVHGYVSDIPDMADPGFNEIKWADDFIGCLKCAKNSNDHTFINRGISEIEDWSADSLFRWQKRGEYWR